MKRFVFFLFILVLIGYIGYFFAVHPQDGELLHLVPAESIAVVDWKSPADSYQSFMKTRLGAQMKAIDRPLILSALGIGRAETLRLEKLVAGWGDFSRSLFFREFFGGRTVLALLPENGSDSPATVVPAKSLVLLNTAGRKAALLKSFALAFPDTRELPVRTYQGYSIHGYLVNNVYPLYFVTDRDILIAALDPAPVRQCLDLLLDRILQKNGGLAGDSEFRELKGRTRELDDFFLYVDLAPLKHRISEVAALLISGTGTTDASVGNLHRGVRKAVFYHQPLEAVHQFTSIVRFDASVLPSFQKRVYERPPMENRKLVNMPANLVVYFWSNWLDLPAWWQTTRKNATGRDIERTDQLAEFVETGFGMTMEQVLDLFGHQVGLDIKEIKSSGLFPVPRICLCVEVTDRVQVEALLKKMVADLPVHRSMVADVPVVSLQAAGGLMQPSYALLKNYLILADGRDQIEDILRPGGKMLTEDPDFLELDMGMLQPSNLVFFARTARMIEGMKELASWLGTIIAIRDEQAGARSKVLVDQAVIPLLDGLSMVKATAVRSYTGPGELVLQSTMLTAEE